MKIAFYHELHKGGARRGTNEFANQLKKIGHDVDLFTIDYLKEEAGFYSHIYKYKFIPKMWKGNDWKTRLYKDTIELIKLIFLNKKIATDINFKGYDAVYVAASQFIETPFILQFLKLPSFFYCNDPYYRIIYEPELFKANKINIFKKFYEKINRLIRKYLDLYNVSKIDYVISISKYTGSKFTKIYKKINKVIYYGVDTNFFTPGKDKKIYDLLFIGSKIDLDGYPFFKEVVSLMHSKPIVKEIFFEDVWLSDTDILNLYRKSKIFVSVSYNEPLGMVPMEAMSCAVPVVAVDEAGHKETIVNNKTGYLLKRNSKLFAEKLDYLINNPKILRNLSVESRREMINKWDWGVKGRELEKFIKDKTNGI